MEKLGFPMGSDVDTVPLQNEKEDWTGAREIRIDHVAKDHRVVLLMGDNLGDFSDKASKARWGHDWIMFANPEYGSWESAAFGGS